MNALCEDGAYDKDSQEPQDRATRSEGPNPSLPRLEKYSSVEGGREGGLRPS